MTAIVRAEGLSKDYGPIRALRGVDLEVRRGEIFGYLGPNGAGKTTTIRLLLDLIRPTEGRLEVFGLDPRRDGREVRRRTGYLPGELALYERLTGRDLIVWLGELRGGVELSYVEELADRLSLDLDRPIRTLSRGNKQKVGLVHALCHRPDLLVLDEPTSGLDPLVQLTLYDILREVTLGGATVFFSSHVLSEVERICDRVAIVRDGEIVATDEIQTLKMKAVRRLVVRFATAVAASAFREVEGVRDAEVQGEEIRFVVEGSMDPLIKALARHQVIDLVSRETDLEEIFLAYYGGEARGASSDEPDGDPDA